jgi:antitoxin (DNA-binding transcriptional repressor) of toxin-antitoxin stability system
MLMLNHQVKIQKDAINWDEVLLLVQAGTEVIVMQGEHPLAKLMTPEPAPAKLVGERILGAHPGAWTSDDFDDPLPDEFWLGNDA